jgi:hypothetical protein
MMLLKNILTKMDQEAKQNLQQLNHVLFVLDSHGLHGYEHEKVLIFLKLLRISGTF